MCIGLPRDIYSLCLGMTSWNMVLIIFLKIPSWLDGSIKDSRGGAYFIIQDPDAKLLVIGGSYLFEPSNL